MEQELPLSTQDQQKVDQALEKVATARQNLSSLRKQKVELRKLWSTYKYHNHQEPWYIEIIFKLGADIKDANRYQDELGEHYSEYVLDDPEYAEISDKDKGIKIYNALHNIKLDIADEIAVVADNVMDLWEAGVPLKAISKAYGSSENTTYIFITRQPRFKMRRNHSESPSIDTTRQSM
jgi:hypothetical protein